MDKIVARKLKPWEAQKLEHMKRQLTNTVNSRHARLILLSRGGYTNQQIAERCGCTPTWVRQVLHRFNDGGIESITWYPYYCTPAGPRKFFSDRSYGGTIGKLAGSEQGKWTALLHKSEVPPE